MVPYFIFLYKIIQGYTVKKKLVSLILVLIIEGRAALYTVRKNNMSKRTIITITGA